MQEQPVQMDLAHLPYKTLSEYHFFKPPLKNLQPNNRVLPFRPVSELFSDYALKARFVWMPDTVSATIVENEQGDIVFPDGAVLIKHFYYPDDLERPSEKRRIIETRLLVKKTGIWEAYPYLWNDQQTDARLKITGATIPVSFKDKNRISQQINYVLPNKNQCKNCHNRDEKLIPIGPKVRNLNVDFDYGNGITTNQLQKWQQHGLLDSFDASKHISNMIDYNNTTAPIDQRARAYLDINCGHCHATNGPGNTSGLLLTWEEKDNAKLGVFKTPVAAGIGAGPHTYNILPGNANESIMVYRMNATQPGIAMPEIGRVTIHREGVDLISQWINEMD